MDAMTGSAFYTYLLREFKRTDKETEAYDAITDAVLEMRLRDPIEDFKVEAYTAAGITALGDYRVDLPTDFGLLMGNAKILDGNSSWELNKLTKTDFDEKYPDINETAALRQKPIDFCVFANQLLLGPVPDSTSYTYEIPYTTDLAAEITSATTSVPFTSRFREVLRDVALGKLYKLVRDFERAEYYRQMGEAGIRRVFSRERQNVGAPMTVPYQGV